MDDFVSKNAAQDFLSDQVDSAERPPCLDDLLADNLTHGDLVVIDGVIHKFQHKEKRGPHIFFDTVDQKTVPFWTGQLIAKMNDGSYIRPGANGISSEEFDALDEAGKQRLRLLFGCICARPRSKAQVRWLYTSHYINRIGLARACGKKFSRIEDNAVIVVAEVDDILSAHNRDTADPKNHLIRPRCIAPRTVLKWVENEIKHALGEVGQVHGNSLIAHEHRLPNFVLDTIAVTIREAVHVSGKMTPQKVFTLVRGKLREHNKLHGTTYPFPGKTTVYEQYKLHDPWLRLAKLSGKKAADLEYGAVGKLVRPTRILELAEMDGHKFDLHGELGKTSWGQSLSQSLSKSGIDRFWVCVMLDVYSGYPLGFQLSFEQDSLLTALACVEHALTMKTYVSEKWPHIKGDLLGYGKPVRLRYDNAKPYIGLQMSAGLARIGVSFQNSIPNIPNTKPYVERFNGTLERDFIEWLPGATGSNPREKGERKPQNEARIGLDDFVMLFHEYLIAYARRPQPDRGGLSPERIWMNDCSSAATRPRSLTKAEAARVDVIASIEVEVTATREGILWKGVDYQSTELQDLRLKCGAGVNARGNAKLRGRIPLKDIGRIYVYDPMINRKANDPIEELEVISANPHVHGRTHWQHMAIRSECAKSGLDPDNYADYEEAFLRLFRGSLKAMGVKLPGANEKPKVRLTGGQAPRFTGIFMEGYGSHALSGLEKDIKRYDVFREIKEALGPKKAREDASLIGSPDTIDSEVSSAADGAPTLWSSAPIEIDDDDQIQPPSQYRDPETASHD
jgi:putative transposase